MPVPVDARQTLQIGFDEEHAGRASSLRVGAPAGDPGVGHPADVLFDVDQVAHHGGLQFRADECEKAVGAAHAVPGGVVAGKIAGFRNPARVFLALFSGESSEKSGAKTLVTPFSQKGPVPFYRGDRAFSVSGPHRL